MTVFRAIIELTRASWRVLSKHPVLLWFPILSMVAVVAITLVVVPIVVAGGEPSWLVLLGFGFVARLAQVFFTVGLTAEALKALRGEAPSLGAGITATFAHTTAILSFTAITSMFGFLLAMLGRRSNAAIRLARLVIGNAWGLATYLAIPVMVQERRGGVPSLKRAGELFKRTWGETTLSEVGVRVITTYIVIALLAVVLILIEVFGGTALTILVVLSIVASTVGVVLALEAIYRAALYVFAAEGVVPEPFGGPELDDIWKVK